MTGLTVLSRSINSGLPSLRLLSRTLSAYHLHFNILQRTCLHQPQTRLLQHSAVLYAVPPIPVKKAAFVRDRPHMNVGTIGHVDHGKTTLTAAITKVLSEQKLAKKKTYAEIDAAPEEKRRGITINAATVDYSTKNRHYAHIDCPGHADYIKNMITGTAQMEAAILVVAATDGTMPQTREHLLLAKQIGIERLVIYINKADAADEEMLELVDMEVDDVLEEFGFDSENTPVVAGSALCALNDEKPEIGRDSILKLLEEVDKLPLPVRDMDKPFLLPVEQVFKITGRGTVVTGRVERGSLSLGAPVEVLGYNKRLRSAANGIEMFHQLLDKAQCGDQCGVLLKGVKREDVRRGMAVCAPRTAQMGNNLSAQIYMLSKAEGGASRALSKGASIQLYSKSWNCPAFVDMEGDKEMIVGGEDAPVRLSLHKKMVVEPGQRFTVRLGKGTAGYGVVSKLGPDLQDERWVR